mgnify:CR=1 FL=1
MISYFAGQAGQGGVMIFSSQAGPARAASCLFITRLTAKRHDVMFFAVFKEEIMMPRNNNFMTPEALVPLTPVIGSVPDRPAHSRG